MAKENVGKFYEKLAQDAALAEKLNALDKKFADTNEGSADDIAFREKAVAAIVIPLAEEVGLPFTLEELKEYEQEQMNNMTLSEDELDQVAGGAAKIGPGDGPSMGGNGMLACVGFGIAKKNGKKGFCALIGGSTGPVADCN